jgi:hypothetical protein
MHLRDDAEQSVKDSMRGNLDAAKAEMHFGKSLTHAGCSRNISRGSLGVLQDEEVVTWKDAHF